MFDLDRWQEILHTMSKHKLRTALTAFGVFWGILMLVLLLGAGKGLQNGIEWQFRGEAVNSLILWPDQTSMPYHGMPVGRNIRFSLEDCRLLSEESDVDLLTPRSRIQGTFTVRRGLKYASFETLYAYPEYTRIRKNRILAGRELNEMDQREKRKVAVIGNDVRDALFKGNEDPIGKEILIKNFQFTIVGVFTNPKARQEPRRIYIPYSTGHTAFDSTAIVEGVFLTPKSQTQEGTLALKNKIEYIMAQRHQFDPHDQQAMHVEDNIEEFMRFQGLFFSIRTFVWIVGLGTLLAGIIGVSNIMMIIVKERTKEIGIRKALGATPFSTISLVLQESVVITSVAGYSGLVLGVGLLELAGFAINSSGGQDGFFINPEVDIRVALVLVALLVLAGAIAGFFPAWHASRIQPIEALRAD